MFKVGDKVRVVKWEDLPLESIDWTMGKDKVEFSSFGIGKRFIDELSSASEPFTIIYAEGNNYVLKDAHAFTFKDYHLEKYVPEKCVTKSDIKIGDTVVYNGAYHEKYPNWCPEKGTLGTVVAQDDAQYLVSFRKGTTSGDDIWWVETADCEKFDNSTSRVVNDNQKIVFKQKNRKVIATKYIGDKVVARAHATCNKTDSFDFGKGTLIAYSRLIAKE